MFIQLRNSAILFASLIAVPMLGLSTGCRALTSADRMREDHAPDHTSDGVLAYLTYNAVSRWEFAYYESFIYMQSGRVYKWTLYDLFEGELSRSQIRSLQQQLDTVDCPELDTMGRPIDAVTTSVGISCSGAFYHVTHRGVDEDIRAGHLAQALASDSAFRQVQALLQRAAPTLWSRLDEDEADTTKRELRTFFDPTAGAR